MITIPANASLIITKLEEAHFEAYVVGGYVRDALLDYNPQDCDIATSANPLQILDVFAAYPCLKTGIRHGTITVLIDHQAIEVTTFRTEGAYRDLRHPDQVTFVADLQKDIARRDFTINGLAYHPQFGLIDYCGGLQDLHNHLIRCINDPHQRFQEDGLRMMRALRFSSFYQFAIEEKTAQAIHQHSGLLKKISQERITAELLKLLSGADCAKVIETYFDVIVQILPEFMVLAPAQATKYLPYLTRTDQSIIRLMIFLKVLDEAQDELFPSALRRLRLSNRVSRRLKLLHHFSYAALQIDRISLKRLLKETDVSGVQDIAAYQHAVGLVTDEESGRIMAIVKSIRQNNECYSLKQLAVNGNDIRMLVGADTPQIKEVLDSILMLVIEEKAVNDHEVLIMKAAELLKKDVNND